MGPQLLLQLEPPKLRTSDLILGMLRTGHYWWAAFEICVALREYHGIMISDSAATARLRELRNPRFGAHTIESRRREGSTAFEYRIVE
jgi:hypothetical protein